jgi:hypothetical protein
MVRSITIVLLTVEIVSSALASDRQLGDSGASQTAEGSLECGERWAGLITQTPLITAVLPIWRAVLAIGGASLLVIGAGLAMRALRGRAVSRGGSRAAFQGVALACDASRKMVRCRCGSSPLWLDFLALAVTRHRNCSYRSLSYRDSGGRSVGDRFRPPSEAGAEIRLLRRKVRELCVSQAVNFGTLRPPWDFGSVPA